MIEDGIARFGVTQKIDKRDVIGLRTGKSAYDEIEIRRRKPRPTIRPDHREPIISTGDAKRQGTSTVVPFEQRSKNERKPAQQQFFAARSPIERDGQAIVCFPSEENRSSTPGRNVLYLCALAQSHSQIASLQMMDLREESRWPAIDRKVPGWRRGCSILAGVSHKPCVRERGKPKRTLKGE
jgi:hypothetical protein